MFILGPVIRIDPTIRIYTCGGRYLLCWGVSGLAVILNLLVLCGIIFTRKIILYRTISLQEEDLVVDRHMAA